MKLYVSLNGKAKEVAAENVSQLRIAIVKMMDIDITQYDLAHKDTVVMDDFQLEDEMLISLESKGSIQAKNSEHDDAHTIVVLAEALDDLIYKTLRFAIENGDDVIEAVMPYLKGLGVPQEQANTETVKQFLYEAVEGYYHDEEEEEEEEFEEDEEPANEVKQEVKEKKQEKPESK